MTRRMAKQSDGGSRVTVTLARNQRAFLLRMAKHNDATIAFVIRNVINDFIKRHKDSQLPLEFPNG